MPIVEAAYVLALMELAEPRSPYRSTFEHTAEAIAAASSEAPLFAGPSGAAETAALVVAVGEYESHMKPDAEGDCVKPNGVAVDSVSGVCPAGSKPRSLCMLQVGVSNLRSLNLTTEEIRTDIDVCIRAGLRLMRISFGVCRTAPIDERLRHYAGGGETCTVGEDAKRKSIHRMTRGRWLHTRIRASGVEG